MTPDLQALSALLRLAARGRGAVANARQAVEELSLAVADRRMLAPAVAATPPSAVPLAGQMSCLSRAECRELLATGTVGRLGYIARAGVPDIAPVNYVFDGTSVLIRSGPGPKLQAAERKDVVAFEVERLDETTHTACSVVVVGPARTLSAAELRRLSPQADPTPWAAGTRRHVICIAGRRITGRRLS